MTPPDQAPAERHAAIRRLLSKAFRPPVHDGAFWLVQATVVALAALHLYLDSAAGPASSLLPTSSPVALLFLPVLVAALRYGLAGAAATALWACVLWLPDLLLPDARGHPASDGIDLAIVAVVAVFVGIHIERAAMQQRRADAAEEARRAAQLQDARAYAALLLDAHEEERRRIARDLHDDPLQRLIALARCLETMAGDGTRPAPAALAESRGAVLEVIDHLRQLARGLRPPGLDQLGLVAAVRGWLADVEAAGSPPAELAVSGTPSRLQPGVELAAFRIVQEATNNVRRHAAAAVLRVELEYAGDDLSVRVIDDGIGFDVARSAGLVNGTMGLTGMRERADLLGGSLVVSSRRQHGTTVEARLPRESRVAQSVVAR